MKLEQLSCPSCGAGIDMDIKGKKSIFCPFCGCQFAIDDGETTITNNININKNIVDAAAIEKERRKDKENEREYKFNRILIISFLIIFILVGVLALKEELTEKKAIEAGFVQVGYSDDDLKGKNYKIVVEQLENAGFTNIVTIDLDDAGLFTKEEAVENVTIGGDDTFSSSEYYDPNAKIVISYH